MTKYKRSISNNLTLPSGGDNSFTNRYLEELNEFIKHCIHYSCRKFTSVNKQSKKLCVTNIIYLLKYNCGTVRNTTVPLWNMETGDFTILAKREL